MVELPKESTVTAIGSLSLVRAAKQLHDQREDLCQLEIPQPNTVIIKKGSWYAARRARLVILGEVYEYSPIITCTGTVVPQLIRTFPIGSIIFPQALSQHFIHAESLCEYRAGVNTKLLTLNEDCMRLLEFSPEALFHLGHAESHTIHTIIDLINAMEFDLRIAAEDRERAIMKSIGDKQELDEARRTIEQQQRSLEYFEQLCLRLEARLPESTAESIPNDHHQDSPSAAPEITVVENQSPDPDTEDPIDDLAEDEYCEIPDDDVLGTKPTLRPPASNQPLNKPNDEESPTGNRETWRGFPAAPDITANDDAEGEPRRFTLPGPAPADLDCDEGARMTITGVAPPSLTSSALQAPASLRRWTGLRVPSGTKPP